MTWAAAGIAAGGMLAFAGARLLRGFLFAVAPDDPGTFFAVLSFTTIVVLAGSGVAGRRATRVDPLTALRHR